MADAPITRDDEARDDSGRNGARQAGSGRQGRGCWPARTTGPCPALPEIGLASLVMSDGPIGVRGVRWTADDPSVALPSPTALAATWDPELARRAGRLLAQEARRKGVHVLLAPTVNLHRSPLGGRHFEAYSEDPYLTGEIGTGYVRGVQDGGVGTTVKHFVGNDAETDRFTVDNIIAPAPAARALSRPVRGDRRQRPPLGHHGRLQPGQRLHDDRAPLSAERQSCAANGASTATSSPTGWQPAPPWAPCSAASTWRCPDPRRCTARRSPPPSGPVRSTSPPSTARCATCCGSPPASASWQAPPPPSPNRRRPSTATRWPARSRAVPSCWCATRYAVPSPSCRSTRRRPARSR